MKTCNLITSIKSLKNYYDLYEFARTNLKYIDAGSCRTVWEINDECVLKIYKANSANQNQNIIEDKVFSDKDCQSAVAKIYDREKKYSWLISEKLNSISHSQFNDYMGDSIYNIVDNVIASRITPKGKKIAEAIQIMKVKYDLAIGDLNVLHHWGISKCGQIRLLDYGYQRSDGQFEQYY